MYKRELALLKVATCPLQLLRPGSNPALLCSEGPPFHLDTVTLPAVRNRLTVGRHEKDLFLITSSQLCAGCVLNRYRRTRLHRSAEGSAILFPLGLLRIDAARPRLGRSLGLMRRCRAKR